MRVAVAMSGGMDSTAAALMLKREGHEVIGLHMSLTEESDGVWHLAQRAAEEIGVSIHRVDLRAAFDELIVKPFVEEYASGRTPSPCPRCNSLIKMGLLLARAREQGCEKLATGHYARAEESSDGAAFLKGLDRSKDQSYFLFMVPREAIARLLLPLGSRRKHDVRAWLRGEGLSVWEKEESQELCFIPGGDYRAFLAEKGVRPRPGMIIDLQGRVLGRHQGIAGYTLGQRRGLGVSARKPLYVVRLDPHTATVVVGARDQTLCSSVRVECLNILRSSIPEPGERFGLKVRSTAWEVGCEVAGRSTDMLDLRFDEPQSGVAPGQAAVLYHDDRVIGGGWIAAAR